MEKPFTPLLAHPKSYSPGAWVCMGLSLAAILSLIVLVPMYIESRNREFAAAVFFFPAFVGLFAALIAAHNWPGVLVRVVAGLSGAAFVIVCVLTLGLMFSR